MIKPIIYSATGYISQKQEFFIVDMWHVVLLQRFSNPPLPGPQKVQEIKITSIILI
jgi:hypothetical protein